MPTLSRMLLASTFCLIAACGGALANRSSRPVPPSPSPSPSPIATAAPRVAGEPESAPVSPLRVDRVYAGTMHSCAIVDGGDVTCWGKNDNGGIGDGTRTDRPAPVRIKGLRAKELALGHGHTCALTMTGTVACWGSYRVRRDEQTGHDAGATPTPVERLAHVTQISAGQSRACAVTEDGAVWCWELEHLIGPPVVFQLQRVTGLPPARRVSVGYLHACALGTDALVRCWGNGEHGQLGLGRLANAKDAKPSVVPGIRDVISIGSRSFSTCAQRRDGTVWCWGSDAALEVVTPAPVEVISAGATDLVVGGDHTCARLASGVWQCWGYEYREGTTPGDGEAIRPRATTLAIASHHIALGGQHGCARLDDGTAACWGRDDFGQLGTGRRVALQPSPTRVRGLHDVVAIAAGDHDVCARLRDKTVRCWGENGWGQLGDGTDVDRSAPTLVPGLENVEEVSIGTHYACARHGDGTVSCWGANHGGVLGPEPFPTTPGKDARPRRIAGLTNVAQIATGGGEACALQRDGAVSCWGAGATAELLHVTSNAHRPRDVAVLARSLQIAAGAGHICGLSALRTTCFGTDDDGEVGNGKKMHAAPPFAIPLAPGHKIQRIALGHTFTCMTHTDGRVQCFGYNGSGQLGDGTTSEVLAPGPFVPVPPVAALALGGAHACALLQDTRVRCWGDGQRGQLGNGETQPSTAPLEVGELTGVSQLAANLDTTCALRGSDVFCWGDNEHGQIGDGAPLWGTTPAPVDGSALAKRAASGIRATRAAE